MDPVICLMAVGIVLYFLWPFVAGAARKSATNGMVGITTRRMTKIDPYATECLTLLRNGAGAIGFNRGQGHFVWCKHDGNGHGQEGFFIPEQVLGVTTGADVRTTYTTKGTTRGIVLNHAMLSSTHYDTKVDSRVVGAEVTIFLEESEHPTVSLMFATVEEAERLIGLIHGEVRRWEDAYMRQASAPEAPQSVPDQSWQERCWACACGDTNDVSRSQCACGRARTRTPSLGKWD